VGRYVKKKTNEWKGWEAQGNCTGWWINKKIPVAGPRYTKKGELRATGAGRQQGREPNGSLLKKREPRLNSNKLLNF